MLFKHTYRTVWIFCTMTVIYALPLSEMKRAVESSPSHLYSKTEETFLQQAVKHREKRQLSTFVWNNGFLQNIGKAITDTMDRIRGIVSSGVVSDSPIVRMVNNFRTNLAPAILQTVYASAIQNAWEQIRNQAKSSLNEFFDSIDGS